MYLKETYKILYKLHEILKTSIPLYIIHFIKTVLQIYKFILYISC